MYHRAMITWHFAGAFRRGNKKTPQTPRLRRLEATPPTSGSVPAEPAHRIDFIIARGGKRDGGLVPASTRARLRFA